MLKRISKKQENQAENCSIIKLIMRRIYARICEKEVSQVSKQIFEQYESEVRSYCRNFPAVFNYAKGSVIKSEEGNSYIDFFCGAGAVNYGHNNDYIKQKLIAYLQSDGIVHSLDMYTTAKSDFIAFFEEKVLQPRGLNYKIQFAGPTGTNAVEAALKLARKVKQRQNIFALMGAFHGMTMGALALTSDRDSRKGAGVPLTNITHVPAPYMFPELDTIAYMERLLTDDHSGVEKPAAVVIETVQAEGGVRVFDVEWLRRLRALCDQYDILLIVDDIQVGCSRTGTFFSFERAGIVPDMVVVSKSIGGYGMPMALTLFKPELDIWAPGEHNGTFRGNQLSLVAAKAGLEIMLAEKVEEQAARKGEIVQDFLAKEVQPLSDKIEIRGIGLIWGIDFGSFTDENLSKEVVDACFQKGLIIERAGRKNSVVKIMPALVIEEDLLLQGLRILKEAIAQCI